MWYLARGAGIVSLLLLTGSVLLGVLTSVRWVSDRWPRFTTTMLHRNLSLLAVVFLAIHVATVVIDGFAPIRWLDVVVPFASPYRPLWLGLGTIAFDLVLALVATSLLRNRIGPRIWRSVHWLAYACWPVAVVHGMGTGTDTATEVFLAVDALCIGVVILAVWWRVRPAFVQRPTARGWAMAATIIGPLVLVAWLLNGPLASGWASRAGTPAALLGQTAQASAASAGTSTPNASPSESPTLDPSFLARFSGSTTRSIGASQTVTVQIDATLDDGSGGKLVVVLHGTDSRGSLVVRNGTAKVVSAGNETQFAGPIVAIEDGTLLATASSDSPTAESLEIRVDHLDVEGGTVSGSIRSTGATPARGDDR